MIETSERALASIQRIGQIDPIDGADNIQQARVMGWTVVVRKGEFAVGDPCVFLEIDSVLPDGPAWAEFMRPRRFRVKTVRLRGVLSQGLALPTSIIDMPLDYVRALPEGADVTAILGVTKYEPVIPGQADQREIAGSFPAHVPKTDEIRLQSALRALDEIRGQDFYVTTKCDGMSATYFNDPDAGGFIACSRNWQVAPGDNGIWKVAARYRLAEVIPPWIAVQGEVCGPGIQQNRLRLPEHDLFVFNVYDARAGAYLGFDDMIRFCAERGIRTVPVELVVRGDDALSFNHSLAGWLEAARGMYEGTTQRKEGIVVRPLTPQRSMALRRRLSFKVINNDFLLKDED